MNLITRNDTSLAIGLIVGATVAFQQPLHFLLDAARDVEERYHLDLVPALTIVTGVYIFHQYRKRVLSKAEAAAASAEAAQARARSEELERLMTFSQDLAKVLDVAMLQQALWKNLPSFTRTRGFWLLSRVGREWQEVVQDATRTSPRSLDLLESTAEGAVSQGSPATAVISDSDAICFPLIAGNETVGVLGIDEGIAMASDDRKALGAAAALIATALRNVRLFDETREQGVRDRLTGCFNHGQCLETMATELMRAKRSRRPLSIVLFDVDHFKAINDELGHLRGDQILRAVGAQLNRILRTTDFRGRYGGDEFLIILPDTDLAGAERVAEILRHEISTLVIAVTPARVLTVTASIGVATAAPAEIDVPAFIKRTDEALYRAKKAGRNRVCVAIPPGSSPELEAHGGPEGSPVSAVFGTETILVADDEPLMHEFIHRALNARGYTTLWAKNAVEAMVTGESRRGPIDLLLTDIVMPDMLGPELAERIRRIRPDIKVLYMSGFIDHPAVLTRIGPEVAILQKPFTTDTLATKVREALDAPPRTVASTT